MNGHIDERISFPSSAPETFEVSWLTVLKSPLARRLIGFTVLFSSLITFSASAIQLYVGFTKDLQAIETIVEEIRINRSKSIVESVWVIDEHLVQIQLDGIANSPNIESAAILVKGNPAWSSGEYKSVDTHDYFIPLIKNENGDKNDLGKLRITADIGAIQNRVKDAAILVLISNAIKTFLVSVFFIIMFYFLLGRHLVRITQYVSQYSPGANIEPLQLKRSLDNQSTHDELVLLVGSLNKMISVIDDYRIKLSENERVALKHAADLEVANKELEEFSSRTSHDLRAPIISALALLKFSDDAIDSGELNEAKQGIGHAIQSLTNLKELIDNITKLILIKKIEEEKTELNLPSMLNESLELLTHLEGFSRIEVQKELNYDGTLLVQELRFKTIVDNLLSNAVKYQDWEKENPTIFIKTEQIGNKFVLQVRDNGLGIPKEHEKDLFKIFKRFHKQVSFGSGMGMHLMKSSANQLGGELEYINPGTGNGTIFKLVLPLDANNVH